MAWWYKITYFVTEAGAAGPPLEELADQLNVLGQEGWEAYAVEGDAGPGVFVFLKTNKNPEGPKPRQHD